MYDTTTRDYTKHAFAKDVEESKVSKPHGLAVQQKGMHAGMKLEPLHIRKVLEVIWKPTIYILTCQL